VFEVLFKKDFKNNVYLDYFVVKLCQKINPSVSKLKGFLYKSLFDM